MSTNSRSNDPQGNTAWNRQGDPGGEKRDRTMLSDVRGTFRETVDLVRRAAKHLDPNFHARLQEDMYAQSVEEKWISVLTTEHVIQWVHAWGADATGSILHLGGETREGFLLRQSFINDHDEQVRDGSLPLRLIHARQLAPDLAGKLKDADGMLVFRNRQFL